MADIEQRLKFILDRAEARKAAQGIKDLQSDIEKAAAAAKKAADSGTALDKELSQIARKRAFDSIAQNAARLAVEVGDAELATELLNREMDKLGANEKEVASVVKQYDRLSDSIRKAGDAEAERQRKANDKEANRSDLDRRNDRFDEVSRNVGLAGDVQSNLGAVRGLAGAAGATGLDTGLGVAGELVVLTEELPRLKTALAGMPQTIAAATASLGPGGLLVIGVAAGAAALAAVYKASIAEQEAALKQFAAASKDFVDFAAGGGTSEDAAREIENIEKRRDFIESEIARLQAKYDEQSFRNIDVLFNDGEDALASSIEDLKADLETLAAQEDRYTEAIQNNELAVNDAATAEENAAQSTQSVAESYTAAASASDAYSSAVESSAQSAQSAASNITSAFDEVSKASDRRIPIGGRERTGRITASGGGGRSRRSTSSGGGASSSTGGQDPRQQAVAANQKYYEDLARLNEQFNDEQTKAQLKLQDDLRRIDKEGDRAEQDAIRNRDFAALAESREREAQAISDRNEQANIEQRDRMNALNQQKSTLLSGLQSQLASFKSAEQQKLQIQEQAQQKSIQSMHNYWNNLFSGQLNALRSRGGGGGGGSSFGSNARALTGRQRFGAGVR